MRKFLSLFAAILFAGSMMAADPVEIASSTFNGSAGTHAEGWSTTGTGVSRSDCVIIGADENITSPEVDLSNYESITVQIKSRRYGTLSGKKADIAVTFDGEAIGTVAATGTSATTALEAIEYTVNGLSTGQFVFTCTNATSAGSTHGAGINSIVITGVQKEQQGGGEQEGTIKTVYCKMEHGWWTADGAAVAAFAWTDGGEANSDFPGVRMESVEGESGLWKIDLDTALYEKVIFARVNGSGTIENWGAQTEDLVIPADKNLYTITSETAQWAGNNQKVAGAWSEYVPAKPAEDVTFYLVNKQGWEAPKAFVFNATASEEDWPGKAMTKTENTVNGFDVYSYTFKDNFTSIIFNNGAATGTIQTADLAWDATKPYFVPGKVNGEGKFEGTWYASLEAIPAPVYNIAGAFTGWKPYALNVANDKNTATLDVQLPAGEYEFKVVRIEGTDTTWYTKNNGDAGAYGLHREYVGVAGVNEQADNNLKVTADEAGAYLFTWTFANDSVGITFPAKHVLNETWSVDDKTAVAAETQYVDNYAINIKSVYGTTLKENARTFGGFAFSHAIQVRTNGYPSATNLVGAEQSGSTSLVITAKEDVEITMYYNRQVVSGAGTENDNKDIIVVDQAAPTTKLTGAFNIVEILSGNSYLNATKTLSLTKGHVYTVTASGTTLQLSGIRYASDAVKDPEMQIAGAWDIQEENWVVNNMTLAQDKKTATYEVELAKGEYEFKVIKDGAWLTKDNGEAGAFGLHRGYPGVAGIKDDAANNLKVTADVSGAYLFTWTLANDSLNIAFPALPKFCVTGDSALVVDAGLDKAKAWNDEAFMSNADEFVLTGLKADQEYHLQVIVGEAWKGYSNLSGKAAGLKAGGEFGNNIVFKLAEAGDVKVTYKAAEGETPELFKLEGNFYVAPIKYYIAGSMTKWAEEMVELLPLEEKADSLGIAINLEADSLYAFKVVRVQGTDTAWYGLGEAATMKYGNSEGWWIYPSEGENNQANVGLQTTEEGNYAFVVNVAEDHLAVSVAIPVRYYAKYQLSEDGTDWGWKQLTKKDALYMTDTIVYRGSGMNIDNAMSEEPVLYYSHDKANTDVRHFTGDSVVALDTVVFAFNPADSTLSAQLVGRYVAPAVHYYLAGTMTNWKADSIELVALEEKTDSLGVTVALKADSLYAFKVVRVQGTDTAWYGLNETAAMTYGNSEGWWIYKSEGEVNQANVGLQTTKEGEYSFTLKVAEDHLEVSVAIPAPTPTAAVTGSMNNWEGQIPFELAEDEKTATLFVDNMKSGEYDFRMIISGQERSNGWWFKRDVLGAAGITDNDGNAMKLIADVDGDYTITWFFANDSIHFEFPAPAMFYVTGDSALVKDAAGLEKKDEWNAKAIKAEQDTLVLSLKADQEYKLKLIEDGNWEGDKVYGYDALTQEDKAGLSADNDNNIVFKLNADGDVKVVYFWEEDTEIDEWKMTFKLIGDFYVEPEIPHTYTVVGPSLPNKWDEASTASDMTLVEGVYTYVLADVELKAGAHEYKIVEDHAWDVAFPQEGNASFSVEKDGLYDVTFTLNKETKAYTAVPELKQEIIIAPTAVLMGLAEVEPWTVGESMEVAEGFKTASITKHFVPSKAEGDTLKFKVVINDAWRSNAYLYHRDFVGAAGITMNIEGVDGDMKVVVDVEGDYTFTWTFENDSIGITFPEKPEPVMDEGYYIIGLNGWNVADLTADDMFWSTGIETNEFSINLTLRLNDEFKVVRIVDDVIQEWYPAEGGNYVVDDHHYGATTVYFRPNYDGNEDWFAGCIYVLPTSTVGIDNLDVNAPAVKILRDGQILIIKGNKTFNIQGQLVK